MRQTSSALHNLDWAVKACTLSVLCVMTSVALTAQTFAPLHSFDGTDGALPDAGLVQAIDGNLYGTTLFGGANCAPNGGCGTVFKITPNGKVTTLYSFCAQSGCIDGAAPQAGLVQAIDGNLYGTTPNGGANCAPNGGCGTVFKITPNGELTTLYSFCAQSGCTDGAYPFAGLVQATDGNLYGTTLFGGANNDGTVFEMTPKGTLKTLFSFDSTNGTNPYAGLIQASDGNFYGTTIGGGKFNYGMVFKLTPRGRITTLHSFCHLSSCADGQSPQTALIQATNGDFYGTTSSGGVQGGGMVFRITSKGTFTVLYSFCSLAFCSEGSTPMAGLVQATNGNLYGTTSLGGNPGYGTIFEISPGGELTYPFVFDNYFTDGAQPHAGLVQATNGALYGTTYYGGANSVGTVFSLSVKSATSTALVSSLNPSIYGQSVTWTAMVTTSGSTAPTGKVNFVWEGNSIGEATLSASGVASLTKSTLNADTYPLTAVYSGDANNASSKSAILNQVVTETTSAATISSSANPSTQGQAVTFTATIISPTVTATGPVTFTAGKTMLGTAQLSGGKAKFTTSTLAVGATTVKATYYGDSNIAKSSGSVIQTVQ
jgi:uncharacterized repeat protein (TIGR03803 family)